MKDVSEFSDPENLKETHKNDPSDREDNGHWDRNVPIPAIH